jgi:type III restriction enzyme
MAKRKAPKAQTTAESYQHADATVSLRPEVGTQAQFQKQKPPATYSYDSSLSPQLVWAGKAKRQSFDVPTLPLFVHERLSTQAIIQTLTGHRRGDTKNSRGESVFYQDLFAEASLYRTRDLVPPHLMEQLRQGRVLVTNWHVFAPQTPGNGESARVVKAGVAVTKPETIQIGAKTTTARGSLYLTLDDYQRQVAAGLLRVIEEERDRDGTLKKVKVESTRYVESDTSLLNRVLRGVGGKQNILVMNDEAHHAYRIKQAEADENEDETLGDDEFADDYFQEATVWIDGLDKIHKQRGINFCVDLSATPYFLGRVGQETNRPFPWVVSDFGLVDAIESGLVKIPQLAVRDTTGAAIPGFFNVWHWILPMLTSAERGGKRSDPKPEAILKYADHPIRMLGGLWEELRQQIANNDDPRPPVFILVCKNTKLAKVMYEWLAEDIRPTNIPPAKLDGFRNRDGAVHTIRVDSKVVFETDTDGAKSDEHRWMRFTLDTVGKRDWPRDRQGRELYPDEFEELAKKLERPLHPPGRDVRCIVSVAMLTEGWDCNTVTHIVGLRPFLSQLLCEQVVGRGLRRFNYEVDESTGLLREEVAKVFGVPFEIIPMKANPQGPVAPPPQRRHVHALPNKSQFEIRFPRVEGYTQAVRNRIAVNWEQVPPLHLLPGSIPPEVEVKGLNVNNKGGFSLVGPGRLDDVGLQAFRDQHRLQELVFDLAGALTREYLALNSCECPAHALFPQLAAVVRHFVEKKVVAYPPTDKKDLFLAPYYGWAVERLRDAIRPDASSGEIPEVPIYETHRGPGTTAEVVFFWTGREVREVSMCHLNYIAADTKKWEQTAAYYLDKSEHVAAFVKNSGLGFAIPYFHNGQPHEYIPDFLARLNGPTAQHLILETKGFDPEAEIKQAAALR